MLTVSNIPGASEITACLLVLALARLAVSFISYFKARRQFPGPPVTSIWFGNLSETMADDIHDKWRAWHRRYGPIYQTVSITLPLGSKDADLGVCAKWNSIFSRVVYVGDPRVVSKIANSNWPKIPTQYAGFKPLSGSALFAQMDQERWKQQRKSLAPAFQPQTVNEQYPTLQKYLVVSLTI